MQLANDTGWGIPAVPSAAPANLGGPDPAGIPAPHRTADGLHPRLQAAVMAARYFGMELDPADFRNIERGTVPSAASLSAWANDAGMWSRALRLRWRHLMRFHNAGPVVLLFDDGSAGLLVGANIEHKVVFIRDPTVPEGQAAVPVDELRLAQVWSGEAVLVRANRGQTEADAPFSLRWLAGLVLTERKSLRDIGIASLTMSSLAIFPPLTVMTVVDRVLQHQGYATLTMLCVLMTIFIVYETLLGFARRLIVLMVGVRIDTGSICTCSIDWYACRSTISSGTRPARRCTRSVRSTGSANS